MVMSLIGYGLLLSSELELGEYCPPGGQRLFVVVCEVFSPSSFGLLALRTPLLSLQEVMRFTVVTLPR